MNEKWERKKGTVGKYFKQFRLKRINKLKMNERTNEKENEWMKERIEKKKWMKNGKGKGTIGKEFK